MLTTDAFQAQIHEWATAGHWELIRKSATKRLEAMGYIDLGIGSFKRWIEQEWLDVGLKRDVIARNNYGQYVPVGIESIIQEPTGRRGSETIYEEKKKMDYSQYFKYIEDYKKFREDKEKRQFSQQQETKGIVDDMKQQGFFEKE